MQGGPGPGAGECAHPGCFFCVMKDPVAGRRRAALARFFKELAADADPDSEDPEEHEEGQVMAVSGLWNRAMAHPNEPELVEAGALEAMAALIWKGIEDRAWLGRAQNVYIPYYAAHIIGSYCMNVEAFAERACAAGVVPPLLELLRGRLTWVEQRVAVRALGHIATYDATFPQVAAYDEVLDLAVQLAAGALDLVYARFVRVPHARREAYHCDLLTRGVGGPELEARKAEEWASQLQCWSLQLINCFAFKDEFLATICRAGDFLARLPDMWGGLVNEASPAGVGLLRTICHQKAGRPYVAAQPGVVRALCTVSRSSDDWQYMAVDCLVWLLQDSRTRFKVFDAALEAVADLAELSSLGGGGPGAGGGYQHQMRAGERIAAVALRKYTAAAMAMQRSRLAPRTQALLADLTRLWRRFKSERNLPREDFLLKQAAALVVKLEGNAKFSGGDVAGAAHKYTQALEICPLQARKERVVLYSNRAQCRLMQNDPRAAVSDATRALSLHDPVNRHSNSLWRRAQAYGALGLVKEALLDAIMFVNECAAAQQSAGGGGGEGQGQGGGGGAAAGAHHKVPDYVERFLKKQMKESWLFKDAAAKYGPVQDEDGMVVAGFHEGNAADAESDWETASEEE